MRITQDFLNGVLIGSGAALLHLSAPIRLLAQSLPWTGRGMEVSEIMPLPTATPRKSSAYGRQFKKKNSMYLRTM
jgi:hypothetical protein